MTGQGAIDAFRIYFDRVTSFSAPGYLDAEILLFLNNAQDQFIKDKVFGKNFQPPAFEDNQKRVVDISPLVARQILSIGQVNPSTLYGDNSYEVVKTGIASGRILYTLELEVEVTRTEPTITTEFVRCEPIGTEFIGKFIATTLNKTHFHHPKYVEEISNYYVICDSYTTAIERAKVSVIRRPYPITSVISEHNGSYSSSYMSLHMSVHQEIVGMAVKAALRAISDDKGFQAKIIEEQIDTQ